MQQIFLVKPVAGKASRICWNCKHDGNDNRNYRETVGAQNSTGIHSTFCGDSFCSVGNLDGSGVWNKPYNDKNFFSGIWGCSFCGEEMRS